MSLVSPFGVASRVWNVLPPRGLSRLKISFANAGIPDAHRRTAGMPEIASHGLAIDDFRNARIIAVAEAAERYAGVAHGGLAGDAATHWIWSSAAKMREPILDLTRLPRCSDAEYSHPNCPLVPFDVDNIIRWSRGIDLVSGDEVWVPSAMAIYWLKDRVPAERFWHSISTGYAIHTDPHIALSAAICEVIERDIIEILWSQCLPLPPVADKYLSDECRYILDWCTNHFINILLFDATSDMRVPTVYCLLIAEHDQDFYVNVSCATGDSMAAAADKAVRDGVARRAFSERGGRVKTDFSEFAAIDDGARYMALPRHISAFNFLVDGYHDRNSQERTPLPDDPSDRLRALIDTLASKGMQAIAVDRTTPELARAGLTAVCAIIPDLQPMALHPLARYRAHPRLSSAPALMGYPVHSQEALNPWPQPFA